MDRERPKRTIIVGHLDHGKTSLAAAIVRIMADREAAMDAPAIAPWPEDQPRSPKAERPAKPKRRY